MYRKDTTMILNRNELDLIVELLEGYHINEPNPLPIGKVLLNRFYHAQKQTGYIQPEE